MTDGLYDDTFFSGQSEGSIRSAERVVDFVLQLFPVASVVDVGCGIGGWLRAFAARGVEDYCGVDGDYVKRESLRIPPDRFIPADLSQSLNVGRRFDLACTLEVAEHLAPERAAGFIADLVALADVVLFSAAIPNQGGHNHTNEQIQSYWAGLFAQHGYVALDVLRPHIYGDPNVEWWYQQNILMFCRPERVPASVKPVSNAYDLDRIHPVAYGNMIRTASWLFAERERFSGG